jgi:ABC-type branched-subunit amino acid transport system substrate-binding protein
MSRRPPPSVESALVTAAILALVVTLLAAVHALPSTAHTELVSGKNGDAAGGQVGSSGGGGRAGAAAAAQAAKAAAAGAGGPGALNCGQAGGATDIGVTANSIKLGATVVDSGIGSSFLGPVRLGMIAVQKQVNRDGGICGRQLNLVLKDDGWDRQRGRTFIQNLVEDEKVFALAVVPSSEGLDASANYVDQKGVPVVGSDGMLASQYTHDWIWPVATSTVSLMHIIAKDAYDRGARQMSLVYDRKYRFGLEGAYAYNQAVKRLTGADVPGYSDPFSSPTCAKRFCGIQAGDPSYSGPAGTLRDGCSAGALSGNDKACDFNALLLEPSEALSWYKSGGPDATALTAGGFGAGAAQPLFTRSFAENCQRSCDKLVVWSGFNPPIERFNALPAVQRYVADVQAQSASADVHNQFLEGGYLGMRLLVQALAQVGPQLTRAKLKSTLDGMSFDGGLTQPLGWKGSRFANSSAQGFRINYTDKFGQWTEITRGWVADPWVGQDIRSS